MNKSLFVSKKFVILISLLMLVLHPNLIKTQTIKDKGVSYLPDIEAKFSQGLELYDQNRYAEARDVFWEMINSYPAHQRITIAHIMLGNCYYKLNRKERAIEVFNALLEKYPESNYAVQAYYIRGFCEYDLGRYLNSLKDFLYVADFSSTEKLADDSRNLALQIIDNNISLAEIERLEDDVNGKYSAPIVTIKLARRYLNIGKREKAISLLQNFIKRFPDNRYNKQIQSLLNNTNVSVKYNEVKVGVILPLSGEYGEQAKGVLAGLLYAQKKFNDSSAVQLSLVIKDSEGDIVKVVKATKELAEDSNIIAIIGELERDKTVAIAAGLDYTNIPLIAPTSSGNGITSLNDYTFQLNTDIETRGRRLAEYAFNELNLKTFATLSPTNDYGKQITDSFISTIDRLGGTVIVQKLFYPGTEDIGRQLKAIRELGFSMMKKDSLIRAYTRDMNVLQKRRFDQEVIPVTSIDGIFIPCYSEEIKFIAPQFAFINVRAQLLGGEYWYEPEELRKVQQYVDGLIFCSGYYFDDIELDFIKFRNDFRLKMKRTPEPMELYGYDAMGVLLAAIDKGNLTREDVANFMKNLENFKGIRGSITLNKNHNVNSDIRLVTYKNGRFELIK